MPITPEILNEGQLRGLSKGDKTNILQVVAKIDSEADAPGASEDLTDLQKHIDQALRTGLTTHVGTALNRARALADTSAGLGSIQKQIDDARIAVGGPLDKSTVWGEKAVATAASTTGATAAVIAEGAKKTYRWAPGWAKIPLLGAAASGMMIVASYPVQWISRIWKNKEDARKLGEGIRNKWKWIMGASAGAGILAGAADVAQQGWKGLAPDAYRTDIPNTKLLTQFKQQLHTITAVQPNQIAIPPCALYRLRTFRVEELDATSTVIITHNLNPITGAHLTPNSGTTQYRFWYSFSDWQADKPEESEIVAAPAMPAAPATV